MLLQFKVTFYFKKYIPVNIDTFKPFIWSLIRKISSFSGFSILIILIIVSVAEMRKQLHRKTTTEKKISYILDQAKLLRELL